jgi:hypothetical protein
VCAAMGCPPLRGEAYTGARSTPSSTTRRALPAQVARQEPRRRGRAHGAPEPDLRRLPRLHQGLRRQRGGRGRYVARYFRPAPSGSCSRAAASRCRRRLRLDAQQPGERPAVRRRGDAGAGRPAPRGGRAAGTGTGTDAARGGAR